jgi:tyrosyl-tRNA synthetase
MKDIKQQLEVIKRGAIDLVSEEELVAKLKKGKPLRVKLGMDPTISDLHLGHTVVMQKMRQFQDLGHQAIFLIGDYTAQIGDPSGRTEMRPMLTHAEVMEYAETYLNQAFKILDREKTEVRYNSEWLGKLTGFDFATLSSKYTVARMLERDDFEKRFKNEQPIRIHEFLYPLMQAYDSVALEADVELGGSDQVFNLLVGRDLQREMKQEAQVILTVPLLVGTDGVQKMSKTYNNYIGITEAPQEIFGKIMSISDELMWNYYELLSSSSLDEIKKLRKKVESGKVHPKETKEKLALEIIERYYDADSAKDAKQHFDQVIVSKGTPDEMEEFEVKTSFPLVDAIVKFGLIKSKAEAKRLISQNAVTVNGERITDICYLLPKGMNVVKVGKRIFFRCTIFADS